MSNLQRFLRQYVATLFFTFVACLGTLFIEDRVAANIGIFMVMVQGLYIDWTHR
jgi:hypothetical protein